MRKVLGCLLKLFQNGKETIIRTPAAGQFTAVFFFQFFYFFIYLFYFIYLSFVFFFTFHRRTVASLLSPVQEVSSSPSEITIEMYMYDETEVGHCIGNNTNWHTSVPSCICISFARLLGELLTSWTGERSGATVNRWYDPDYSYQAYSTFIVLHLLAGQEVVDPYFSGTAGQWQDAFTLYRLVYEVTMK